MSQREYFSYRFAVPGYTFILLVIAFNYVPLLKILEITKADAAFGAFLAFLSLFTGSAIGFLISQIWLLIFKRNANMRRHGIIRELEPATEALIKTLEKHGLEEIEDKKKVVTAICDYIVYSEKEKKLISMINRRWDVYHTLSSILLALVIGTGVGIGFRIYYEVFLFNASFSILSNAEAVAEAVALTFVFICVGFLVFVIWRGRQRIITEYCPLLKIIFRRSEVTEEELKEILSDIKK